MASAKPEKCFTCFRRTDEFIRLTEPGDARGEDLHHHQEIFSKHFWFTKEQYYNKIVCGTCWERIEDFHRFYCEVEKMHSTEMLEVKVELSEEVQDDCPMEEMECDDENSGVFAEALCKVEPVEGDSNDEDVHGDPDYVHPRGKVDSDSQSKQRLAKLKTTKKSPKQQRKKKKTDQKEPHPFSFSCKICVDAGAENVEPFTTFHRLSEHFREVHNSPPFVMCCDRKYISWPGLEQHIKRHPTQATTSLKRCAECNMFFRYEKGLAEHMFLMHTPEDQKQFKCDLCSKGFVNEALLRIHINWHEQVQQKNHYCAECDRYFTNVGLLIHHNETQHQNPPPPVVVKPDLADDASNGSDQAESESKEIPTPQVIAQEDELIRKVLTLNCSECDADADTFQQLRKHGREAHGLKAMAVVCCERRFSRRFRLYEHCLFHLNPGAFECDHCKKRFPNSRALRNHKWSTHTPASERPYKCDICGDSFVKEYSLKLHIQRHVELDQKIYQCQKCDKVFSNASLLQYHMHAMHGEVGSRTWICDICAKSFPHRSKLERHRLTHAPEGVAKMKEQCKTCGKWYDRKSLSTHRQLCGMAQPVQCDQCDHISVNAVALKRHQKLRHSDRPKYPCIHCGKEFTRELRLKEHLAIHEGIVLYQCDFCPKTCNSSSNMYTHKKAAHPEQWAQKLASRRAPPPTVPQ